MTKTTNSELQDLVNLKKEGAITEEEFNQLKQDILSKGNVIQQPLRTGIGWQEIVAVLFGIVGGLFYVARAKQSGRKKLIIFSLAFFWNMISLGINSPGKSPSSGSIQSANQAVTNVESNPNQIKSGDFEFSNATSEPYDYSGPENVAGRLIKVSFDAKNTSNKSAPPAYGIMYALKDSQNREFEQAALMIGVMNAMDRSINKNVTDNILPGSSNRVSLIFDVSKDSQIFQLGITNGFSGKKWLKVD
jgi:Short C-terminal domain